MNYIKAELQALRSDNVTRSELNEMESKISHQTTKLQANKKQNSGRKQDPQQSQTAHDLSIQHMHQATERENACTKVAKPVSQRNNQTVKSLFEPQYRDILVATSTSQRFKLDSGNRILKDINEDGFTTVVHKKHNRSKNMRGSSETCTKLKVVESTCTIYVSRVRKEVSESSLMDYIKDKGENCVTIELLKQYRETTFNSFKIVIPMSKANIFLSPDFWPKGLVFRRFK
ncbi:unnamed protein product [Parnassius apollo]|uniref:(apollo) hypothetical protein n=1 Tax=Parnassius apollo TaxID=110799 RepID=A0A8S3WJD3_PARAO|nr:unnamed protein product [Parnassius apollo]